MNIFSNVVSGTIGMVAQAGAVASVGTTLGIAAGIGAVQNVVEKATGLVSDRTSFEKLPSLKRAACLGLVATDQMLHAGFRAFDQKLNSWLKPTINDAVDVLQAPTLDETLSKLRGPDHKQAVQTLREVVLHGSEPDVIYLFGELEKKGFGEDFDPMYFALSDRYQTRGGDWLGQSARFLDGIR